IFAVVDVFFVSRLGPDAVATVGLTESMLAIIYTVAMGLSIGVMATVARRIGERRPDDAADAAVQGIALGLGLAAVIGVTGVIFAPDLLHLMGASPAVIGIGSNYTRMMLGGNGVILLLFLINAIFRGSGDAAIAMRVLWLANGINIVLAPSLIYGVGPLPRLGVTGAAVGTTIGRGIGVLFQLWNLSRSGRRVAVRKRHLTLHPKVMLNLVRLSGAGTFQVVVGTASWIGLVRILSTFGSYAVAGYTIGIRVILFALLPSWGLANAAATMVGQNLGAGRADRAEEAVWTAARYNMIFLGGVGLAFLGGAPLIAGVFTTDPVVYSFAVACLRTVSLGFLFDGAGMV
ncbi:MAG TPA: MATE family efflux transporter, partial [Gemmatimonadales bacterium]|nr:MATE family efflux transporter [Gemmatimonadales bacterium]